MNPEKIGKFICELRKEKNLSQTQLADRIPISRQGVSKWERGITTPDPQTLIKLSELFNVTIDELLRGERRESNSIKDLEETTLNILDESNKKTKKIKRISIISIFIIIILLLAFLSYYFVNSYNTMEVYKIGNTNDKFTTTDGILILTKEKYYLKLGNIKNKNDVDIKNIKLYYKKDNKKVLIVQDSDVDNILMMDSYGYGEKFSKNDIKNLKDNLYIEITYNENEKESIKLEYRRLYNNNSLFFLNQKGGKNKNKIEETITKEIQPEEPNKEEKEENKEEKEENKEEIKPVIQETPKSEPEQKVQEQPKEQELTINDITNKIKETCIPDMDSYICESNGYLIFYFSSENLISIYKNEEPYIDYQMNEDNYVCTFGDCKNEFNKVIKENLFS